MDIHAIAVTSIVTTSRWYHNNIASDVMAARYPHNPEMPYIRYAFDWARQEIEYREQNAHV